MVVRSDGPPVVRLTDHADLAAALAAGGVDVGHPVVVLVGGADGMDGATADALGALVRDGVLPTVTRHGATVLDGGTDAGVMRSVGRARAAAGAVFPLVGVAAEGTVILPDGVPRDAPPCDDAADLEPHHTHVLLVPGADWGDESPWISAVATAVAVDHPAVTVLVNGGHIAFDDAARSLAACRPLVVVAGSGRAADAIADARTAGDGDAEVLAIAASPLIRVVRIDDPRAVATAITTALGAAR